MSIGNKKYYKDIYFCKLTIIFKLRNEISKKKSLRKSPIPCVLKEAVAY